MACTVCRSHTPHWGLAATPVVFFPSYFENIAILRMCNNINPWRATFDDLISSAKCMELIAIQRALSVLGYRPGVRSTTLMDCVMSAPQLLIPLVNLPIKHSGTQGW